MSSNELATPPSQGPLNPGEGLGDSNTSSNSLVSSSNDDDPGADLSLRPTSSAGLSKLTDRLRKKSVDERRGSNDSGRRLSTLKNKLKKTKSKDVRPSPSFGLETGAFSLSQNQSNSSLGLASSSRSSLLTDDNSENER